MHASAVPRTLKGAGLIVGLQGVASLGFAVALLVRALGGNTTSGGNLVGQAVYFVILGAGVLLCGAGLVQGKLWARSPSTVAEILLLGVAWYAIGPSKRPELGIPVAALCVLALFLLYTARSRAWWARAEESA